MTATPTVKRLSATDVSIDLELFTLTADKIVMAVDPQADEPIAEIHNGTITFNGDYADWGSTTVDRVLVYDDHLEAVFSKDAIRLGAEGSELASLADAVFELNATYSGSVSVAGLSPDFVLTGGTISVNGNSMEILPGIGADSPVQVAAADGFSGTWTIGGTTSLAIVAAHLDVAVADLLVLSATDVGFAMDQDNWQASFADFNLAVAGLGDTGTAVSGTEVLITGTSLTIGSISATSGQEIDNELLHVASGGLTVTVSDLAIDYLNPAAPSLTQGSIKSFRLRTEIEF